MRHLIKIVLLSAFITSCGFTDKEKEGCGLDTNQDYRLENGVIEQCGHNQHESSWATRHYSWKPVEGPICDFPDYSLVEQNGTFACRNAEGDYFADHVLLGVTCSEDDMGKWFKFNMSPELTKHETDPVNFWIVQCDSSLTGLNAGSIDSAEYIDYLDSCEGNIESTIADNRSGFLCEELLQ